MYLVPRHEFSTASSLRQPLVRGQMIGRPNATTTREEQRASHYLDHVAFSGTPSIVEDERRIFQSDVRQHRQRHKGANRLRRSHVTRLPCSLPSLLPQMLHKTRGRTQYTNNKYSIWVQPSSSWQQRWEARSTEVRNDQKTYLTGLFSTKIKNSSWLITPSRAKSASSNVCVGRIRWGSHHNNVHDEGNVVWDTAALTTCMQTHHLAALIACKVAEAWLQKAWQQAEQQGRSSGTLSMICSMT